MNARRRFHRREKKQGMTVAELRRELRYLPGKMQVVMTNDYSEYAGNVDHVELVDVKTFDGPEDAPTGPVRRAFSLVPHDIAYGVVGYVDDGDDDE